MSALSEKMLKAIRDHLPNYPNKQAVTLPALHIVQDELRCVPKEAIGEIAEILELHDSQVHDTLSFYGFFRSEDKPLGKHRVWVCRSISCMLRGGEELLADLCAHLDVAPGDTTADGKITLEFAECLGACEQAPCMLVNDECAGSLTAESGKKIIDDLK